MMKLSGVLESSFLLVLRGKLGQEHKHEHEERPILLETKGPMYKHVHREIEVTQGFHIFSATRKKVGGVTNKYPHLSTLWWGCFVIFHSQITKD
jgi:hypothetical protein